MLKFIVIDGESGKIVFKTADEAKQKEHAEMLVLRSGITHYLATVTERSYQVKSSATVSF